MQSSSQPRPCQNHDMTTFISSVLNIELLLFSLALLTLSGILHIKMVNPLLISLRLHSCDLQTPPYPQGWHLFLKTSLEIF